MCTLPSLDFVASTISLSLVAGSSSWISTSLVVVDPVLCSLVPCSSPFLVVGFVSEERLMDDLIFFCLFMTSPCLVVSGVCFESVTDATAGSTFCSLVTASVSVPSRV